MDVDSNRHDTFDILDVCASSIGKECLACELAIVIEPEGRRIPVVIASIWRLPYLRTFLTRTDRNDLSIYEERTDAFQILLHALHCDSSKWTTGIPHFEHLSLDVLHLAKKYGYPELERAARRTVASLLSAQTARAIAAYIDHCTDATDGDMALCKHPARDRSIAAKLVAWFRTRRPGLNPKYARFMQESGSVFPSWCLIQLAGFSGDDQRQQSVFEAIRKRAQQLVDDERELVGWDHLLVNHVALRDLAHLRPGLMAPCARLDSHVRLRRHNSSEISGPIAPELRSRRASQPCECSDVADFLLSVIVPHVSGAPTGTARVQCVLPIVWRPKTGFGCTPSVPFDVTGLRDVKGYFTCETKMSPTGTRQYDFILGFGAIQDRSRLSLAIRGKIRLTYCVKRDACTATTDSELPFTNEMTTADRRVVVQHIVPSGVDAERIAFDVALSVQAM